MDLPKIDRAACGTVMRRSHSVVSRFALLLWELHRTLRDRLLL